MKDPGKSSPPPGYDDQSIIPKERLRLLSGEFEKGLNTLEDFFKAGVSFQVDQQLKLQLNSMHYAAKELGNEYLVLVEELNHAFHAFESNLCLAKLSDVHTHLNSLKIILG